ncbi:MAG: transglycosylase domain-containing protein [Myxococcota bacterium]
MTTFSRAIVISLLASLVTTAVGTGIGWAWIDNTILSALPGDLSDLKDFRPMSAVEILDHDGEALDNFYLERRFWVPIDDLPDHVWQAYVAAEDQHFFEHAGIDITGISRAFLSNLTTGDTGAGRIHPDPAAGQEPAAHAGRSPTSASSRRSSCRGASSASSRSARSSSCT